MADAEQLAILHQGVDAWNKWRAENPGKKVNLAGAHASPLHQRAANLIGASPTSALLERANLLGADLHEADLSGTNLLGADLAMANLKGACLRGAYITMANLDGAHLEGAHLEGATLIGANLYRAFLEGAYLNEAHLQGVNLTEAHLEGAHMEGANLNSVLLVDANLEGADLTGCKIYGVSAWGVKLNYKTVQKDLVVTPYDQPDQPAFTVDNLEVAQFIYLLLHNEKIRDVIDTITSKVVLILGRFTLERKAVLDAIREELRSRDYVPVIFDFDKPSTRNTLETITLLARMARFIIADITDPISIPQELVSIVPVLPSVPVKPILQKGHEPWGMYDAISCYPWVLELYYYPDMNELLASIKESIIVPAEEKVKELNFGKISGNIF
jgi:uncharacterized protein YjbI with pentapeptide repeats